MSLIHKVVRNRTVAALMRQKSFTREKAEEAVATVEDDLIDSVGAECGAMPPVVAAGAVGALGDGTILAWITGHLPQILQIVQLLVSLLATFA